MTTKHGNPVSLPQKPPTVRELARIKMGGSMTETGSSESTKASADYHRKWEENTRLLPFYTRRAVKRGRPSKLDNLLRFKISTYKKMLTMVQGGVADHIAARIIGVHKMSFYKWMTKGREDAIVFEEAETEDERKQANTEYRIFWLDIQEARARARAEVEIEVRKTTPLQWLRTGPGSAWGDDDWRDNPTDINLHIEGEREYEEDYNVAPATSDTLAGALITLEQLGLVMPGPNLQKIIEEKQAAGLLPEDDSLDAPFSDPEPVKEPGWDDNLK